jgi:hypothetical protein
MAKAEKSSAGSKALETEYAAYLDLLPRLAHEEGKFALIHHSDLAGVYETYQDALAAGYEKFGLKPFLVKQIAAAESPVYLRS